MNFIKQLNKKLWLNFKMKKWYITTLKSNDTSTNGIWTPKYNKIRTQSQHDSKITKNEITDINNYTWKGYWHNLVWDWSAWGYVINTDWTKPYKCDLETLQYAEYIWVLWNPIRTIVPADDFTENVIRITKAMKKEELSWIKYRHLKKDKEYESKAKDLYYYGFSVH